MQIKKLKQKLRFEMRQLKTHAVLLPRRHRLFHPRALRYVEAAQNNVASL